MIKTCPNEEMVADYLEGRLAGGPREAMEAHLSSCARCLEELLITGGLAHSGALAAVDPVPPAVTEAAVALVQDCWRPAAASWPERIRRSFEVISGSLSEYLDPVMLPSWQSQPVRSPQKPSADDLIRLRKLFRDIDTEIEIQRTSRNKTHIRLRIASDQELRKMIRVNLKSGGREISSQLAEGGAVLFEDIPFGNYTLDVTRDGVSLGEYSFVIRETAHGR